MLFGTLPCLFSLQAFEDNCFKIDFAKGSVVLRADTQEDVLDWINALRLAMPQAHVIKEGMLKKRGEVNKAFQERFFELSDSHIVYLDDVVREESDRHKERKKNRMRKIQREETMSGLEYRVLESKLRVSSTFLLLFCF